MKKTLLSIFSLAFAGATVAQTVSPSWTIIQNASFTVASAAIKYMDAIDNNTMWCTGYDGTAPNRSYNWWSKTTNAGATFTSGNVFPDTLTYNISNIEGIDGSVAWVAAYTKTPGAGSRVLKTTDGGATWLNMNSAGMYTNSASFANFVSFLTPSVGICNGDPVNGEMELWRTTDGGATWSAIAGSVIPNPLPGEFAIVNVYCKEGTNNLWFGTNKSRIFRTNDAGLTWNVSAQLTNTLAGGNILGITDVAFVDPLYGVTTAYFGPTGAGSLVVYNTTDGGANWVPVPTATPGTYADFGANDVCAIPGTSRFASCGNATGFLSFSTDNGSNWNNWNSLGIGYVTMDFANSTTGWASSFTGTNPSVGGVYKYSGPNLFVPTNANANFIPSNSICNGIAFTMTNTSSGAPTPTYTWSSNPAATISNSTGVNPTMTFTTNGIYTITLIASNIGTTSTISKTVTVATCVGLNEIAGALNEMSMYPNPASSELNIEIPGVINYTYHVTDMVGKSVIAGSSYVDKAKLDVSHLAKGIYFLHVQSNGYKAVKKIVVE